VLITLKVVPGPEPVKYDYLWMHGDATRARFQSAIDAL
jgi:hypothetical protein